MLRRTFIISLLLAFSAATAPAQSQPTRNPEARLVAALRANRLPLAMEGGRPAGAGWDWLVREAAGARFTLIGEEHGVAETARLASALFTTLRESGYSRMAVELSPVIAQAVEAAARRGGVKGITDFLTGPGIFTFSNMREEAQFLADVVDAGRGTERVLWGFDREIFSDRYMISRLETRVPREAQEQLRRLKQASADAWVRHERTGNGDDLFLLSEDSALVTTLRALWPNPDSESAAIMRTLEASLAIEAQERAGGLWPYAQRRAQWMRGNFAALVNADQGRTAPKTMMKFGYNHVIRGANYVNTFDVGAMADEVAALSGERAFHILVLPGPGSQQAVPGPAGTFRSVATDDVDDFRAGDQRLTRVFSNANAAGHEVIDLRPLRALAVRGLESWNSDAIRTIHGYDAVVIWKGASASTGLKQSP